jgi:pimeloyl-ACP methyl ester carboxylesterase
VPVLPFGSLSLLAPALGFFGAPESMDRVRARVSIWWGTEDAFCPRSDVEHTLAALGDRGELRVAEGAGHFSFMHAPPPNTQEPLGDRARFLETLTLELARSISGSSG